MQYLRRPAIIAMVLFGTCAVAVACGSFGEDDLGPAPALTPDGGGIEGSTAEEAGPKPPCDPANLVQNKLHCGRCDHDCLGGECEGGVCKPSVLATLPKVPIGIAVDERRVVWAEGNLIYHCDKRGCANAPTAVRTAANDFHAVVGTPKHTLFTAGGGSNGHAGRLALDDTYEQLGLMTGGSPQALATDGTQLVALNDANALQGGLYRGLVSTPGLSLVASRKLPSETMLRNWAYVALNGSQVFVADYGTVHGCSLPSCAAGWSVAAGGINGVRGLAATSTDLYWTVLTPPSLQTCSIQPGGGGCGTSKSLAGGRLKADAVPHDLFFHGDRLHVTSGDTLGTCVPATCDSSWTEYAVGETIRGRPAADDTAIFWIAYDVPQPDASAPDTGPSPPENIRLMKLAK